MKRILKKKILACGFYVVRFRLSSKRVCFKTILYGNVTSNPKSNLGGTQELMMNDENQGIDDEVKGST